MAALLPKKYVWTVSVTNGEVVICIFNLNLLFPVRSVIEQEEKVCFMKTCWQGLWGCFTWFFFIDISGICLFLKLWITYYLWSLTQICVPMYMHESVYITSMHGTYLKVKIFVFQRNMFFHEINIECVA